MRIAHFADCLGMYAEVHGDGLPNLHLACAIPNTRYLEIIVVDDPVAERDEAGELGIDKDGCVTVPERPGMGWTVSVDELLRHPSLVSTA